jgi:adenosylcobinamide-GDP ribazoletransferase
MGATSEAPDSGPDSGLGADYSRSLSRRATVVGVSVAVAIATLATGWWAAPLTASVVFGAVLVTLVAKRSFGGISGDILGAVEQVGECLVLIVVSGLALRHQIWWA